MLCKSFEELTHQEKVQFIGKLCHAFQTDEVFFRAGKKIINHAEACGLFDNVKILPDGKEENNNAASNANSV